LGKIIPFTTDTKTKATIVNADEEFSAVGSSSLNLSDMIKEGEFRWDKHWKLTDEQAEKNENIAVKAMAHKEGTGIYKVQAFY